MSKLKEEKQKETYKNFLDAVLKLQEVAADELKEMSEQLGKELNPSVPSDTPSCGREEFQPFEIRMLEELRQLDERTKKLGLFMDKQEQPCKERVEITYLEVRAMERQYEAMKAYRDALYERCSLRGLV